MQMDKFTVSKKGEGEYTKRHVHIKTQNNFFDEQRLLISDFKRILDFDNYIDQYVENPISIKYTYNNKVEYYSPSLLIYFTKLKSMNKTPLLLCDVRSSLEIKKEWIRYKSIYTATIKHCSKAGWHFRILNETRVRTPYLENIKFLTRYKNIQVDENNVNLLTKHLFYQRYTTPSELILVSSFDKYKRGELLFTLWHLIANHRICCDLIKPLRMDSEIWHFKL